LASVDCTPPAQLGQPRSVTLINFGISVPVVLRSGFGEEESLSALIDTGSQYCLIDEGLVARLKPQWVDRWRIGAPGNPQSLFEVYQIEIEIPGLQIREFTGMIAALGSQRLEVVLGRTQLRSCTLTYDGLNGTASLSR
jgi:predicted aspartyl protease